MGMISTHWASVSMLHSRMPVSVFRMVNRCSTGVARSATPKSKAAGSISNEGFKTSMCRPNASSPPLLVMRSALGMSTTWPRENRDRSARIGMSAFSCASRAISSNPGVSQSRWLVSWHCNGADPTFRTEMG